MPRPRWSAIETFCASPEGAATRGRGWAVWCASPSLLGAILWGTPDETMAHESTAAFGFACHEKIERYTAILDARRLDRIDERALQLMIGFFDQRRLGMAAKAERFIVVRPARDLVGTVLAGILPASVANARAQIDLHSDLPSAVASLTTTKQRPAIDAAILEALAEEAIGADGFCARLRRALDAAMPDPDIALIAAELGQSTRTLQRRLREEQTTFRGEVLAARLRSAARLLRETDDKITAIALGCGFPSSQHFASAFRRSHHMQPSQYRDAARRDEI